MSGVEWDRLGRHRHKRRVGYLLLLPVLLVATVLLLVAPVLADTANLNPSAAGDKTELLEIGALTNWEAVSTSDGDTSYVTFMPTDTTTWYSDLYNLPDQTPSGDINSVTVYIEAKAAGLGNDQPSAMTALKTHGVVYDGIPVDPPAGWTIYSTSYADNPFTGVDWTWDEVNGLQAGISLRSSDSVTPALSYCTHVWVVVDYSPNRPPVIVTGEGDTASVSMAENTTRATDVNSTDPDGDSRRYSIIGGADAAKFKITSYEGYLDFLSAPDFENPTDTGLDNVYEVIVQVEDNGIPPLTDTQTIYVTVTDVNEYSPSINGGDTAGYSVAENTTAVADVDATDADTAQTLTYSISGGNDSAYFNIDPSTGVLSFAAAPDFETPADLDANNVYEVIVQVVDSGTPALTDTQTINVTVTDVNEAPSITSGWEYSVPENTTAVGTVTATDPDAGQTLTYSISGGVDADKFTIVPGTGELSFITAPDYENPTDTGGDNVYDVTVQVTDDGTPPLSGSLGVAVTVTDVLDNTAPVLTGVPASATIPEMVLYTFDADATDADIPPQTLTFSLVGAPAGAAIDPATGVFTWTPAEAQGPGTYPFTVRVTDGVVNTDAAVTLTVTDVNLAPVLTGVPASATIPEMVLYTFDANATDSDIPPQGLVFSLVGAPAGAAIDPATGVFTWTPTEAQGPGTYPFTVRVTDGVANTDAAVTLKVTDVNLAPTDISLSKASVKENKSPGTVVGAFSTTDPDLPPQTFTYTLVSGTGSAGNASFAIVGNELKTAVSFNQEAQGTYSIRVRSTDSGGLWVEKQFTITIEDVDEPFTATEYFHLVYTAGAGGTLTGDTDQYVRIGQDGSPVTAVPALGYRFVKWSDGFNKATRTDIGITEDLAVEAEFALIPKDRWSDISDAQWLALYGLTAEQIDSVADGRPDGTFAPNASINRGQFAKMAVDGFGIATLLSGSPFFADVGPTHYFFGWVQAGAQRGILTGYPDDTYRPARTITRQQANSILGRYLVQAELAANGAIQGAQGSYPTLAAWFAAEGAAVLAPFADASQLAKVHAPYTAYLVYHQVVMGNGAGLNPLSNLTRAQAAAMIYRAAH